MSENTPKDLPRSKRFYKYFIEGPQKKIKELESKIYYDSKLEGVYNMQGFLNSAKTISSMVLREKREDDCQIVFIDMDQLKKINDNFGHKKGDMLIELLSQEIQKGFRRKTDIMGKLSENEKNKEKLGRRGGDEFLMIIPDTKKEDTERILENIRNEFEKKSKIEFLDSVKPSFSYGLSNLRERLEENNFQNNNVKTIINNDINPDIDLMLEDSLKVAEHRMYRQKEERKVER